MIWLVIILAILLLLVCWLLLACLRIEIDSRIPCARFSWQGIGYAEIRYTDYWFIHIGVLFYQKRLPVKSLPGRRNKPAAAQVKRKSRHLQPGSLLRKIKRIIKGVHVNEWQLAVDTGDYARNAQLYPLNFIPAFYRHLLINFTGDNYLIIKIQSRAWKIIYAMLR